MQYNKKTHIALVGVSDNQEKYGFKIFRDLLANGYNVTGVNPKGGTLLGKKIYTSLAKIPAQVELALLVVPPVVGIHVIQQAKQRGITEVWLQPGAQSEEIIEFAQKNDMHSTQNRCFMVAQNLW